MLDSSKANFLSSLRFVRVGKKVTFKTPIRMYTGSFSEGSVSGVRAEGLQIDMGSYDAKVENDDGSFRRVCSACWRFFSFEELGKVVSHVG